MLLHSMLLTQLYAVQLYVRFGQNQQSVLSFFPAQRSAQDCFGLLLYPHVYDLHLQ